ncbi:MAG: DEAD/DEAH box helicase family protein, partial [Planctomycetota bacterium]|nr:DEAD/DEAH box helicase family protein [Planctomycetota bacterium]
MSVFRLVSGFQPCGDQPRAIESLSEGLRNGKRCQTLLGVTGSGKTFTMANVIAAVQRPTLVISHNKTLAAQLYSEFHSFFPENAVHYFVSYYDYYQPEAYIPQRDIYIEKDADINEDIDRLRLAATSALMSRRDVVIVATVSCIYGLGSPEDYAGMVLQLRKGDSAERTGILKRLVDIQYERNEVELRRGTFRARGDVIEVLPSYEQTALRISSAGNRIETIELVNPLTLDVLHALDQVTIFPAKHFVMPHSRIQQAISAIRSELADCVAAFKAQGKLLEAQRLEARTKYDLELLQEVGYCKGIENYSRHLSGRLPGQRPFCLIDYFPRDLLTFVDESHVTLPQLRGMFNGDKTRKDTLI